MYNICKRVNYSDTPVSDCCVFVSTRELFESTCRSVSNSSILVRARTKKIALASI